MSLKELHERIDNFRVSWFYLNNKLSVVTNRHGRAKYIDQEGGSSTML